VEDLGLPNSSSKQTKLAAEAASPAGRKENRVPQRSRRHLGSAVRYPNHYTWLVFLSALDIWITWIVLHHGGREANALADGILRHFGAMGLVAYKFILVALVVILCELIGKRNERAGAQLASAAIVLTCLPIAIGIAQLLARDN
jgi:Domain of unknown function (DUF5658)